METNQSEEKFEGEERDEIWGWSWGAGTDGQLGNGAFQDEHLPQPLSSTPPFVVSHIACGGAHSIALTRDGRVFTWGRGSNGQLGQGNLENYSRPKFVSFFNNFTVSCVSAGWNHSGFITDTGELFMCGDGSFGQLGTGDVQSQNLPVKVMFFSSDCVKKIACGMRHSLVSVASNLVYGFGAAKHGQIGKPESGPQKSYNNPVLIKGFGDSKVDSLFANGDHSAALTVIHVGPGIQWEKQ